MAKPQVIHCCSFFIILLNVVFNALEDVSSSWKRVHLASVTERKVPICANNAEWICSIHFSETPSIRSRMQGHLVTCVRSMSGLNKLEMHSFATATIPETAHPRTPLKKKIILYLKFSNTPTRLTTEIEGGPCFSSIWLSIVNTQNLDLQIWSHVVRIHQETVWFLIAQHFFFLMIYENQLTDWLLSNLQIVFSIAWKSSMQIYVFTIKGKVIRKH